MAIGTYAQYKEEVSEQWAGMFTKASVTTPAASAWTTSFQATPDAGVHPTTVAARQCNYLTAGSLIPSQRKIMTPGAVTPYWLTEMELQIAAATSRTNSGIFMLLDRLADVLPGLTSTTVTPIANIAVTGLNLTGSRYSDGRGVMAALVCSTVVVGSPVITITYTNQAGVAGKVSQQVATGAAAQFSVTPIPLADGDTGIQAITSYNIVTAGTSGAFTLVLYKPIACFAQPSNSDLPGYREMWEGGAITRLYPEACLEMVNINNALSTTSGLVVGRLGVTEG